MAIRLNEKNIKSIIKESLLRIISENVEAELMGFHGSNASFNSFDLSFIGKGEGSQQYGYGIYITGNKETGTLYADIASFNSKTRGQRVPNKSRNEFDAQRKVIGWLRTVSRKLNTYGKKDPEGFITQHLIIPLEKEYKKGFLKQEDYEAVMNCEHTSEALYHLSNLLRRKSIGNSDRFLYTVDIPDGPYLYWDNEDVDINKKIFAQWQKDFPEQINALDINSINFKSFGDMFEAVRGFKNAPRATAEQNMWQKDLTLSLAKLGYVGIEVPIGRQKGKQGDGIGMNYIVFDANNVQITGQENMNTNAQ